jgi:hypothetical protein
MWLLNTSTLKLRSFFENIPNYVILSHTWGEGEVAFEDIDQPHARSLPGYKKILGCCKLAIQDGFEWAWIDTCCIDKRSSAELSEAINSMYDWYWQSSVCYAYLSDVTEGDKWKQELESSRWFTRGWTLQELLAPDVVEFYNHAWSMLGTKSKLLKVLERVTKIERKYLLSRESIQEASIATKFSWAALRKTTRVEDMTYCLLGLVQVNMPMLYGEGNRAFYRLQLEIIKQNNEHSIFAWEPILEDWQMTAVLARSPRCFENPAKIQPTVSKKPITATTHEVTNNGLRITLPSLPVGHNRCIVLLDCEDESGAVVGIWLENLGNGRYQRLAGSKLVYVSKDDEEDAELLVMYLAIDSKHDDDVNDTACQLAVREVLAETDEECWVANINFITRSTVKVEIPSDLERSDKPYKEKVKELSKYLFDDFVLNEGEAAIIRLNYSSTWILVALRRGRPLIRHVPHLEYAYILQWEEISSINSGAWDLLGDCIDIIETGRVVIQVESKKQLHYKKMQWFLVIRRFRCLCGTPGNANDREACICLEQGLVKLKSSNLFLQE